MKSGAKGTGSAGAKGKGGGGGAKVTKKVCIRCVLQPRQNSPSIPPKPSPKPSSHITAPCLPSPPPVSRQPPPKEASLTSLFQRQKQFIINASQPASDKIFDVNAFEKFLHDKIKVDNRVGNLGDTVQISQQGEGKIEVVAHIQFSGRYLKYLYVFLFFSPSFPFFLGGGEIPSSSGVFSLFYSLLSWESIAIGGSTTCVFACEWKWKEEKSVEEWNTKANTRTNKIGQDEEIPQEAAAARLVAGGEHEPGRVRAALLQRGQRRGG